MTLQMIRKPLNLLLLFIAATGLSTAGVQQAGPCTGDTLANYIQVLNSFANGCTLGPTPLTYYNFQFETLSNSGLSDGAGNINVAPGATTDLGFSGFQSLSGPNLDLTYLIGFNIDPAPVLTGDSISLDPPFGIVSLSLYVCLPQTDLPFLRGPNPSIEGDTNMYCASTPDWGTGAAKPIILGTDSVLTLTNTDNVYQTGTFQFPTPVSQVGILLQLSFSTTGASPNASVGGTGNAPGEQLATPEPGTWLLIGSGLLITVLLRRYKLNRLS